MRKINELHINFECELMMLKILIYKVGYKENNSKIVLINKPVFLKWKIKIER